MNLSGQASQIAAIRGALSSDRAGDQFVATLKPGAINDTRLAAVEDELRAGVRGFSPMVARLADLDLEELAADIAPDAAEDGESLGWHVDNLNALLPLREVRLELIEASERMDAATDTGEALQAALEMAGKVAGAIEAGDDREITEREGLMEIVEEFEKRITGEAAQLMPTFPAIDEHIGGLAPGDLVVVGAETGGAKTSFAISIAANTLAGGKGVAIFSCEMPARQIRERLLCASGSVPVQLMRAGNPTKSDGAKIMRAIEGMKDWRVACVGASGWHVSQIEAKAAALKAQGRADLIVVDYVQLVTGDGEFREQEVAGVSRRLKALAAKLSVPVVALSQLNEDGKVRESRAVGHDADFVFNLDKDGGEVSIDKNRHGPAGITVDLDFVGTFARWEAAS